ncbi:MAG: hypothetical protein ACK443_07265 [Methylococcaceae bacterium]|jgi:hypothetical protein
MTWQCLFPSSLEEYRGPRLPVYFLACVAIADTVRSLIHMFAADSGAQSIAGMAVDVAGGPNLIALVAQLGVVQLLLALFYWLTLLRYRSLIPCMLLVVVIEQLLRIGIGAIKPLEVLTAPPGAIASWLILPVAILALMLSLRHNGTRD